MFSEKEWDGIFGPGTFIELTSEERKYLALAEPDKTWTVRKYYSKTNYRYNPNRLNYRNKYDIII